jgi:SAM-dependent methyltransferase
MGWQQRYLDRFYPRSRGFVDGTTEFHEICARAIRPQGAILEIGAGPDNPTSRFLATLGPLSGIDVDPEVRDNPSIVDARVIDSDRYAFESDSFDACVSNYVLEHIEDPVAHLREVARVLRPGGVYAFRTPNRFHYVALVARYTPHVVHRLLANRLRNLSEDEHDPYPTWYRLNSRREIRRAAESAGLRVRELRMVEKEPSYGMAARLLFLAFMAYERVVNASALFAPLRVNIFGVLEKPE